jgi:hypothetical protein
MIFTIVGVEPLPKEEHPEKFRYLNGAWQHKHEGAKLWHPIMRRHRFGYQNRIVMFDSCLVKTTLDRDMRTECFFPSVVGIVRAIRPVSWGFVVDVEQERELKSFDLRNLELCSNVWYCQARRQREAITYRQLRAKRKRK